MSHSFPPAKPKATPALQADKSSWSAAERQALEFLEEKQPKWRRSYLGPKTEEQARTPERSQAEADLGLFEREGIHGSLFLKPP